MTVLSCLLHPLRVVLSFAHLHRIRRDFMTGPARVYPRARHGLGLICPYAQGRTLSAASLLCIQLLWYLL